MPVLYESPKGLYTLCAMIRLLIMIAVNIEIVNLNFILWNEFLKFNFYIIWSVYNATGKTTLVVNPQHVSCPVWHCLGPPLKSTKAHS